MSYYEILSTVIAVVALWLVTKTFKADHERRKKQATIEYVGQILRDARYKIDSHRSSEDLTNEQVSALIANPADSAEWRNAIGAFEHLAVGVNAGVYDKDILYRMAGGYITRLFTYVEPYVQAARGNNYPRAYCEFEALAHEFEERHRNNEPLLGKGDIKHSRV
jgi:hypothetical protein